MTARPQNLSVLGVNFLIVFHKWKSPLLLLAGIGISNIGAWVYLISLNLMIFAETGSALAMAILYILAPVAAICTNGWAGSFIDRTNTRRLMIGLDLFRAMIIALIPLVSSIPIIYLLVFIVNMGSAVFQPAAMVYMTKLIPKEQRQRFNALRGFIDSAGILIGPAIAGVLFLVTTTEMTLFINAVALGLSAIFLLFLPNVDTMDDQERVKNVTWKVILDDAKAVATFSRSHMYISYVYVLFCTVTIFMTAIDSLEAAFAKDVLMMTDTSYGLFLVMFGIGIVFGSALNAAFTKYLSLRILIGVGTPLVGISYMLLFSASSFIIAVIGGLSIGFFLTFANTGFLTFYQNHVPASLMGRFDSLFGIFEAVMIIFLTLIVGITAEMYSIRAAGLLTSALFLLFGLIVLFLVIGRGRQI
ncbi:lysine-specific permease [Geomicrobium sp. JCM 19039]|nr:lysine-specific permease [Geomicrobium sp. JCM 19039]